MTTWRIFDQCRGSIPRSTSSSHFWTSIFSRSMLAKRCSTITCESVTSSHSKLAAVKRASNRSSATSMMRSMPAMPARRWFAMMVRSTSFSSSRLAWNEDMPEL